MQKMVFRVILCALFSLRIVVGSLPAKIVIESEVQFPIVRGATGVYSIVWKKNKRKGGVEAHYKSDASATAPRYLYRSTAKKAWIITSSEENIEKDKGTIISLKDSSTPIGLSFKFYSQREWTEDTSFTISEFVEQTKPTQKPTTDLKSTKRNSTLSESSFIGELDQNGDGILDDIELMAVIGSNNAEAVSEVNSALSSMDRNKDGKLAVLEALGYLADLGPLNSAHEVREWLVHAVQVPKEHAQVLFQAGITGLDFKELIKNQGQPLTLLLRNKASTDSDESLHNIDLSVKRIVRAMKLILLGIGDQPLPVGELKYRELSTCNSLEIYWESQGSLKGMNDAERLSTISSSSTDTGASTLFAVHKYHLERKTAPRKSNKQSEVDTGEWMTVFEGHDRTVFEVDLADHTYIYRLQSWNQIGRSPQYRYMEVTPCSTSENDVLVHDGSVSSLKSLFRQFNISIHSAFNTLIILCLVSFLLFKGMHNTPAPVVKDPNKVKPSPLANETRPKPFEPLTPLTLHRFNSSDSTMVNKVMQQQQEEGELPLSGKLEAISSLSVEPSGSFKEQIEEEGNDSMEYAVETVETILSQSSHDQSSHDDHYIHDYDEDDLLPHESPELVSSHSHSSVHVTCSEEEDNEEARDGVGVYEDPFLLEPSTNVPFNHGGQIRQRSNSATATSTNSDDIPRIRFQRTNKSYDSTATGSLLSQPRVPRTKLVRRVSMMETSSPSSSSMLSQQRTLPHTLPHKTQMLTSPKLTRRESWHHSQTHMSSSKQIRPDQASRSLVIRAVGRWKRRSIRLQASFFLRWKKIVTIMKSPDLVHQYHQLSDTLQGTCDHEQISAISLLARIPSSIGTSSTLTLTRGDSLFVEGGDADILGRRTVARWKQYLEMEDVLISRAFRQWKMKCLWPLSSASNGSDNSEEEEEEGEEEEEEEEEEEDDDDDEDDNYGDFYGDFDDTEEVNGVRPLVTSQGSTMSGLGSVEFNDPQEIPLNICVGEMFFAMNPRFKDGTRLRVGPHPEADFNDVEVLNDASVLLLELDKNNPHVFGCIRVIQSHHEQPEILSTATSTSTGKIEEGWIRLCNLSRSKRVNGLSRQKRRSSGVEHGGLEIDVSTLQSASMPSSEDLSSLVLSQTLQRSNSSWSISMEDIAMPSHHWMRHFKSHQPFNTGLPATATADHGTEFARGSLKSSIESRGIRLGEGHYGTAYLAQCRGTNVVVKVFKQGVHLGAEENFASEVAMLIGIRHPNTILFMGACIDPPERFIVTEYMPGGDLYRLVRRPEFATCCNDRYPIEIVNDLLCDICKGMAYLHGLRPPIIHGDLSSMNILLSSDLIAMMQQAQLAHQASGYGLPSTSSRTSRFKDGTRPIAKVADFGIARHYDDQTSDEVVLSPGNLLYASPEVIKKRMKRKPSATSASVLSRQNPPAAAVAAAAAASNESSSTHVSTVSDVYSFAIIVAEVYSCGTAVDEELKQSGKSAASKLANAVLGHHLLPGSIQHQQEVEAHGGGLRPQIPQNCSDRVQQALPKMWHADVSERPSFLKVMELFEDDEDEEDEE